MSTWGFKNNLSLDNNKYIRVFDSTGIIKTDIIGLDNISNLNINSALGGDLYLNSNNLGSVTFLNVNNSKNVLINSKLGIGINTTSNINANLTLIKNGFIGINTTQNSNDSFLGLAGSSVLSNTAGSRMLLYGIDNTNGNKGNLNLYTANSTTSSLNFFTGNDSNKFQILSNGVSNFSPNGSTIRLSVSDLTSTFTNQTIFSNTDVSNDTSSGSVIIKGGVGVIGNANIGGNLYSNSVSTNNLITSNISVGNIYMTNLYQDSVLFKNSQWTTIGNTLFFGSGGSLVGINTSSPTAALTVNGDFAITGGFTIGSLTITNFTTGTLTTRDLNIASSSYIFGGTSTIGNNVLTSTDIQGLLFTNSLTRSFVCTLSISTVCTVGPNFFTQFTVEGVQTNTGWVISDSFIGDSPNISLSINSLGQIQCTSLNVPNWFQTTVVYQVTGYFINTFSPTPVLPTSGNFSLLGTLTVNNTIESTATNNGSTIIFGGLGVAKSVNIGGNLTTLSSSTLGGTLIPNVDTLFDIGSSSNRWRSLISTNISSSNSTITNIFSTSISVGSLSSGNIFSTNISTGTLRATSISSGTLNVTTSITTSTLLATSSISTGQLQVSNISTGTLSSENIFSTNISVGSLSVGNIFSTNISSGTLSSGNIFSTSISVGSLSSGNIFSTSISVGSLSSGNIFSTNITLTSATITNLIATNTTITNLITTKITGVNSASGSALDLALNDNYADLRVIRNSTNPSDKNLYLNFQAGATSSTFLYSNNANVLSIVDGNKCSITGALSVSTSITTANLLATSSIGVNQLQASNITTTTLLATGNVNVLSNVNGPPTNLIIKNTNSGSSAYTIMGIHNNNDSGLFLFINSSTRTADGGTNTATIRNDIGPLRLQNESQQSTITLNGTTTSIDGNLVTVTGSLTVTTSITTSTLLATTSISTGQLQVSNISTGTLRATSISVGSLSVGNIFSTNISSGTLNVSGGITTSTLLATTSISTGQLQVSNISTSSLISSSGIGIGTSPTAQLQLSNTVVNRKLVLFDNSNNDHQFFGFGINTGTLRYQTADSHRFYVAINSVSSNEVFTIQSNGTVRVPINISSTSPSSGSLIVAGGIGVAGNGNFGGYLFAGSGTVPTNANQGLYSSWNESGGAGESIITYTTGTGNNPSLIIRRLNQTTGIKNDVARWFSDSRLEQYGNLSVTGTLSVSQTIQSGSSNGGNSSIGSITFPVAFNGGSITIIATMQNPNTGNVYIIEITGVSLSSFSFIKRFQNAGGGAWTGASTDSFNWVAIRS
jgi:hypothetical protein